MINAVAVMSGCDRNTACTLIDNGSVSTANSSVIDSADRKQLTLVCHHALAKPTW